MKNLRIKPKYYIVLFTNFLIYSITGILSKLASNVPVFSIDYDLCYIGIIFILLIYALIWQQILKYIDLSVAMSFKPFVLVLNCLWAVYFFDEKISAKAICGLIIIMIGMIIVGVHNE